ncbi:MAG: COX15/CtaA family protein [Paracoccaceae bacterium]
MAGQRSIFEDVGSQAEGAAAATGRDDRRRPARAGSGADLALHHLRAGRANVILVGGLTRLSDAGLSITEWRPVTGAIPPTTDADWQAEFQKYQQSPQFQLMNSRMWTCRPSAHLLVGMGPPPAWPHHRPGLGTGVLFFWVTRRIPVGWAGRILGLGLLGGLQGAVGWWMVASGLTGQMVSVASYRLAVHLGIGFAILGLTGWFILSLSRPESALLQARRQQERQLVALSTGLMHAVFLQVLLGALVAGIDAGRAFPTWPLMGESFFPADAFYVPGGGSLWRAFFENPGLVQFMHRIMGYLVFAFGVVAVLKGRRSAHATTAGAFLAVGAMLLLQVTWAS